MQDVLNIEPLVVLFTAALCTLKQTAVFHSGHWKGTREFTGASLSEPHTSMTALRKRVCMLVCLFGPTTYHKFYMSTFKYFTMMECPRRRVLQQKTEQKT